MANSVHSTVMSRTKNLGADNGGEELSYSGDTEALRMNEQLLLQLITNFQFRELLTNKPATH